MTKFEILTLVLSGIAIFISWLSLWFSYQTTKDNKKNEEKNKWYQLLSERELPCSIPVDVRWASWEREHYYSELKIHKQLKNWELDRVLMDTEWDVVDSYKQAIQTREKIWNFCNFYSKQGILDYLAVNYGCEIAWKNFG